MRCKLKASLLVVAVLGGLLAPVFAKPANAWCYNVGSHYSATMNWEWNGSDAEIRYSGDHGVSAVYDTNYSVPTMNQAWVYYDGSKTNLIAGAGARLATWGHRVFTPYGSLYATGSNKARNLSSDVQACT